MKRILIPTDFTEISVNSIVFGLRLAEKLNLGITVIHVIDLFKYSAGATEIAIIAEPAKKDIEKLKLKAHEKLTATINEINSNNKNKTDILTQVLSGDLTTEITTEITNNNYSFIIMALEENKDFDYFLSNNTNLFEALTCPVMLLSKINSNIEFKTGAYITGFKKPDLNSIIDISITFNSSINVIHFSNLKDSFESQLISLGFKQLVNQNIKHSITEIQFLNDNETKELSNKVLPGSIDFISFNINLFELKSIKKMVNSYNKPLLIYPNNFTNK